MANWQPTLQAQSPMGYFRHKKYIYSFYFHEPKNVKKNTALEIALNIVCFISGENIYGNCFYRSFVSSVVLACNGGIIQQRVSFVLLILTCILKCSMPTFTLCFPIYFSPKKKIIYIFMCFITVFPISHTYGLRGQIKKKKTHTQIYCTHYKVNRNVTRKVIGSMGQNNILAKIFCGSLFGDYFTIQVPKAKILVVMAPKVVVAWKIVA